MRAAIDDVHHRNGQDMRIGASDITVERHAGIDRRRLGDGQRHAEDRIGAELALVRRAVQLDHRRVDLRLQRGVHPADRIEDRAIDGGHCLADALALVAVAAIAQFDGLMRAGRSAGGNRGAAHRSILEHDIDLDGRVAAAVENLAADNVNNSAHVEDPCWMMNSTGVGLAEAITK